MARLQILELPEGSNDDRPPFVLVVDQVATGPDGELLIKSSDFDGINERIGARAVFVFEETIDIPANDVQQQIDHSIQAATAALVNELNRDPAHERTDIARDMDRLANHKAAITDALGMVRLRDWDDIRNVAAVMRKERDAQAAALERVRSLHDEPETMDSQNSDPASYLHGYRVAISTARRATWDQPTRTEE